MYSHTAPFLSAWRSAGRYSHPGVRPLTGSRAGPRSHPALHILTSAAPDRVPMACAARQTINSENEVVHSPSNLPACGLPTRFLSPFSFDHLAPNVGRPAVAIV